MEQRPQNRDPSDSLRMTSGPATLSGMNFQITPFDLGLSIRPHLREPAGSRRRRGRGRGLRRVSCRSGRRPGVFVQLEHGIVHAMAGRTTRIDDLRLGSSLGPFLYKLCQAEQVADRLDRAVVSHDLQVRPARAKETQSMHGGKAAGVLERHRRMIPRVAAIVVNADAAFTGNAFRQAAGIAMQQVEVMAGEFVERAAAGGMGESPVDGIGAELGIDVTPDIGAQVPVTPRAVLNHAAFRCARAQSSAIFFDLGELRYCMPNMTTVFAELAACSMSSASAGEAPPVSRTARAFPPGRRQQYLAMQQFRYGDDDRIDVGMGKQLLIIAIRCHRVFNFPRRGLESILGDIAERDQLRIGSFLECGDVGERGVVGADDAQRRVEELFCAGRGLRAVRQQIREAAIARAPAPTAAVDRKSRRETEFALIMFAPICRKIAPLRVGKAR